MFLINLILIEHPKMRNKTGLPWPGKFPEPGRFLTPASRYVMTKDSLHQVLESEPLGEDLGVLPQT